MNGYLKRLHVARVDDGHRRGFTRVELAILIAVVAMLALMSMPAIGKSGADANATICLNNKLQLMRGWQMYWADNSEKMPGVVHGGDAINPGPPPPKAWCSGWMAWDTTSTATNIMYLIDPRYSQITTYIASNRFLYRCPADKFVSAAQKRQNLRERIRSISANVFVGEGNAESGPVDPKYAHARVTGDLRKPAPKDVYVYLDEHPDSINDPAFFSPSGSPGAYQMVDYPAALHDGSGGISYADGHVEMHRWRAFSGMQVRLGPFVPPPNSRMQADAQFLVEHTPLK